MIAERQRDTVEPLRGTEQDEDMSEQVRTFSSEDEERREPGVLIALLAVLVMLGVTAILAGLIFVLMIAISPLEQRQPRTTVIEIPAGQTEPAAQPSAQPPQAAQPAQPTSQVVPQTAK